MTTPLYALMGFVFWTLLLLLGVGASRVATVMRGQAEPTSFPAGVPHGGDMYWRLNRAHLNCLENLPLFTAVILTAFVTGLESATIDMLSRVYIGARVAQSVTHISSGSATAINIRFGFFLVQVVCVAWIAYTVVS